MSLSMAILVLAASGGQGKEEKTRPEGERTLHAEGSGLVYVKGQGLVTITGEGSLWYKDLAGDAQISERAADEGGGWRFVSGIGSFTISGSDFIVMAMGNGMAVDAEGKGKTHLVGKGSFQVHNRSGAWEDEPKPVPYGALPR